MPRTFSFSPASGGFTLVELAIVMTIIGLLIGGILKGQELISNASLTATIAQVKGYRAAVGTFKDMYNAMPGDMANATTRLPECSAASNCFNGDGNGMLGTATANFSHNDQSATVALPAVETTMLWKHLADANLITGVVPDSDPLAPAWGITHPSAKIGGGFHVLFASEPGSNQANGHYFILRLQVTGDPHPLTPGIEVLSPVQAMQIDTKMDDGNGRTGEVRADDAGGTCDVAGVGTYQNDTRKDCLLIFELD